MARRGGSEIAWLLAAACSPSAASTTEIPADFVERYAAARCAAPTRCACDPSGWVDTSMCVDAMHALLDDRVEALREQDVRFDTGCYDELLAFWESDAACDAGASAPYCALVRGDGDLGAPCASVATHGFSASSCSEGLFCGADARCSEPAPPIELHLGEACLEAQYACVDGTFCDTDTGVCATRIEPGQQCFHPTSCIDAAWCADYGPDGPGTCEAKVGEGEACDSTSAWDARPCLPEGGESRYCTGGTCTSAVPSACGPWL